MFLIILITIKVSSLYRSRALLFHIGLSHAQICPYMHTVLIFCISFSASDSSAELSLDLSRVTEEILPSVPQHRDQTNDLVSHVVDLFWEKRRYGESFANLTPPPSYFISPRSPRHTGENTNSADVYKRMVFDVTKELLTEMYADELEDHDPHKIHSTVRHPPTMLEILKPRVQNQVHHLLQNKSSARGSHKWISRKRKDNVDLLLVDELKAEEPDWVNYDIDELTVKNQICDAIFDSLLIETGQVCMEVIESSLTTTVY